MTINKKIKNLNAAEFSLHKDDVFGRISSRYDKLCDVFSLGIHRLWKRKVAKYIANENWEVLLDGATGTGDIILRICNNKYPIGRSIIASDISPKMLSLAQKRLVSHNKNISFQLLNTEKMCSIINGSIDAYSISLGLKICNRQLALQEAFRVLKSGGRLIILESSHIPVNFINQIYLKYMSICMPVLGYFATGGDSSAYKYLLNGIREFPCAEQLKQEIEDVGFRDVRFERLSFGIVAIHTAYKP